MHGKERAIAPLACRFLKARVVLPAGLDTDQFGTFSREIPRAGTPLDAARAKIDAALASTPGARIGIASEGSFGPHPYSPFVAIGTELVVWLDRQTGLEVVGAHTGPAPHFASTLATSVAQATAFAQRMKFPGHGIILIGARDGKPAPEHGLHKDIDTMERFESETRSLIHRQGAAWIETDMRAHRNPTRMRAIKRAMLDLVRNMLSRCPACSRPGFVVTERVPGLPCSACDYPTDVTKSLVSTCAGCGYSLSNPANEVGADPSRCDCCNP